MPAGSRRSARSARSPASASFQSPSGNRVKNAL
jgi:hypothetical protein